MKQIIESKNTSVEIFYMTKDAWHKAVETDITNEITGMHTVNALKNSGLKEFVSVAEFQMPTENGTVMAEKIFAKFNSDYENPLATPEGQSLLRSTGAGHTSMSVGDFILFDNKTIMVVKDSGWEMLPASEVAF